MRMTLVMHDELPNPVLAPQPLIHPPSDVLPQPEVAALRPTGRRGMLEKPRHGGQRTGHWFKGDLSAKDVRLGAQLERCPVHGHKLGEVWLAVPQPPRELELTELAQHDAFRPSQQERSLSMRGV